MIVNAWLHKNEDEASSGKQWSEKEQIEASTGEQWSEKEEKDIYGDKGSDNEKK